MSIDFFRLGKAKIMRGLTVSARTKLLKVWGGHSCPPPLTLTFYAF
jgi:hypothetical protein